MKRYKTKIGIFFALAVLLLPVTNIALADSNHSAPLEVVVEQITATHNVSDIEDIDCSLISSEEFERLGDAAMQEMAGNQEAHEQMDQMMGGEGSESLTAMHEHMGRMYVDCNDGGFGMGQTPGGGMMQHMMGGDATWPNFTNNNSHSSMMGFNSMGLGFGWFGGIIMIAFWVLVIAGIVLLIQKMTSRDDMREYDRRNEKTALNIIKERYARGEIDKKEFEEKKKDLV